MVRNHMKRLVAPRTWNIHRKERTFITMPNPGGHNQELGTSINTFLKEIVNVTRTTKESKFLLTKQEVLVNGRRIRDDKYAVGLFDLVKIPSINKNFRLIVNSTGTLAAKEVKVDENMTLQMVTGKSNIGKDKVQINLMSGRNILLGEKEANGFKTGDSIIVTVPDNKIKHHVVRDKGVHVFIFTGKHVGKQGVLEDIQTRTAKIKVGKDSIETNKKYIFVTGKEKPEVEVA